VDGTLTLKKWYIIACFTTALGILATAFIPVRPGSLPLLTGVIILSHFVVSFVALSANGLAAHDTPPEKQGRVSGFMQAGYMGGTGVGGGAGLWLAQHLPAVWMARGVLALCCLLCCFALFFVNEPVIALKVKDIGATLVNVVTDVWDTLKTKLGVLAMILSFLPIGTCAAGLLFAAIAKDWNTGANVVALITGLLGGFITGLGSLTGGWLCDKIDRKLAYLLFGLFQAGCAVAMAWFPHTTTMFVTWTLFYSFSAGMCYCAFNAYTLEAIGKGAAATKFETFAGLSNIPIYTMTFIAGLAYTKWGASGMLKNEAVYALLSAVIFMVVQPLILKRRVVVAV